MHHYKVVLGQLISQAKNSFTLGVLTLASSRLLYIMLLAFKNGSYYLLIIHCASKFLILMIQFGGSEIGLQDGVLLAFLQWKACVFFLMCCLPCLYILCPLVMVIQYMQRIFTHFLRGASVCCYGFSLLQVIYWLFFGSRGRFRHQVFL